MSDVTTYEVGCYDCPWYDKTPRLYRDASDLATKHTERARHVTVLLPVATKSVPPEDEAPTVDSLSS